MLTITVDVSADLKRLKRLERDGKVQIFAVAIENHNNTSKIKQKELPIAVVGSKIATIGNADIAADHNKYSEVQNIIGRGHHADALHLEGHRKSGRDIFVTDDNDFLSKKAALFKTLGIRVATVDEIDELTQI